MEGLWIEPIILALSYKVCSAGDRLLLARICYRAAAGGGVCTDSNVDLAESIGMHAQSVSDGVKRLKEAQLLTASIDRKQANLRTIQPRADMLEPYVAKADKWAKKQRKSAAPPPPNPPPEPLPKPPSDYKPNADSPMSETLIGSKSNADSNEADYKPNADSTISQTPIGSKPNADSPNNYKEIENKGEEQRESSSTTNDEPIEVFEVDIVDPVEENGGESDAVELEKFTQKLVQNRRLHEALHRHFSLTDAADRTRWITDFVFDQWAKSRLADRNNADLIAHCQSWVRIKLDLLTNAHANQRSTNNGRNRRRGQNGTEPSHDNTGTELDQLLGEYYRT